MDYIGNGWQRQLQDETRFIQVLFFSATYIGVLTVAETYS